MPNESREMCLKSILAITKKYNWDEQELAKLREALKNYGHSEFNSALVVKDANLINQLEEVVVTKSWKLTFNHDNEDGFWAEVERGYFRDTPQIADLKKDTRRGTLREAIYAAIQFFNQYVKIP